MEVCIYHLIIILSVYFPDIIASMSKVGKLIFNKSITLLEIFIEFAAITTVDVSNVSARFFSLPIEVIIFTASV